MAEAVVWLHARDERFLRAHELLAQSCTLVDAATDQSVEQVAASRHLETFHVLATSAAADTALQLAAEQPQVLETLVLEAPRVAPDASLLQRIRVPTLVVFGTRDALSTTGRVYREHIPDCHFVLVYDAGAEVSRDRPEAFASLVADFLQRRDAFIVNDRSSLIHP